MTAPMTQLYVYLIWGTWEREPMIARDFEERLDDVMISKCREMKCRPIAVGGMPDHVHLLVELHPTVAIATLVGAIKGASSHFVNHSIKPDTSFKWQGSYAALTLRKQEAYTIANYIRNQKQHHAANFLNPELELS